MLKPFLLLAIIVNSLFVVSSEDDTWLHNDDDSNCDDDQGGKCKANEIYVKCPITVCAPKSCSDVGYSVPCVDLPPNGKCPVEPGCICKDGYVRNDNGICIPMKKCPSCGGDPNAVSGCGNCNKLCRNYGQDPIFCTAICNSNGCDCRKGHVLDENTGKCVLPKHCSNYCNKPNEVYDVCPAPCPPRRCDVDDRTINCVAPPKPGDPLCEPGCRCADGYYRNYKGICVTWDECPKCPNPNEVFDVCPAPCPPQRCDVDLAVILCEVPPQPGDPECEPGCRCIDGYVKNNDSVCIPRDQCPPLCDKNEVYSDCINGGCQAKNCSQAGFPVPCVKPKICKKGCLCKDGYLRNSNGVCIPQEKCPSCGGDPNAHPGCGVNCGRHCSNFNESSVVCPAICNLNGCDCDKRFVFDDIIGKCVLPEDCTPLCGKNEVYSDCINGGCHAKNCSQVGFPVPCIKPKICKKGCLCKDGYLRDNNGICIPQENCTSCGGDPNAHPGCGVNCGRHCSNFNQSSVICPAICNLNGCDCNEGFVFDDNTRRCVLPKDCSPICNKPHEVYNPCPFDCPPRTCASLDRAYVCPIIEPEPPCQGGCRCEEGFFRNVNKDCVTEEDCRKCPGPHEYFACAGACDNVCANIHEQNQTNCPIVNIKCNEMCYCQKNFARAANNTCIPIERCDASQCGINERYEEHPSSLCVPQYCNELGYDIDCPNPEIPDEPDCVCIEGYVRNYEGICIPKRECPSCAGDPNKEAGCGIYCNTRCSDIGQEPKGCILMCYPNGCECRKGYYLDDNTGQCVLPGDCTSCGGDPNAHPGCGVNCGKHCSDYFGDPRPCPKICKVNGCDCDDGYYYDDIAKKCVLPEKCTNICGKNEVYSDCVNGGCQAKNCSQAGYPVPCVDPKICKKGCLCKNGYLRDKHGDCVPREECPSCGGDPNAHPGCGVNCGKHCSDYFGNPRPCPRICKVDGCDCDDGYYYDDIAKKCVLPEKCTPNCGINEIHSKCINGGCEPKCCYQLENPIPCDPIDPKHCIEGCLCKDGYLRADNGICVPEKECKYQCRKPHQVYDPCPPTCPAQKCDSIGKIYNCPLQQTNTSLEQCNPDCVCERGYYKNKIEECITREDCLKCMGPHEYFSCGGACDNVCATLHEQNQTHCPIINIVCNRMCYCEKNYARAKNNTCIPINKCHEHQCGVNELYDTAPSLCEPQTCSQLNGPITCLTSETGCIGKPGCICISGFVRNNKGVCIPKIDCPQYKELVCGKNEIPSDCVNGGCDKRNCTQLNEPTICIDPICCMKGCVCKYGYLRNNNGDCVPTDQCPCQPRCGINEVPSDCANGGCDKRNCSQLGQPDICIDPAHCIKGCICRKGYLRNDERVCVPIDKCPPICGKNEVYNTCIQGECGPKNCSQLGFPIACPRIDPKYCIKGCLCDYGYVRDDNGVCIPKDKCPSCGGDPNAKAGCGVNCNRYCSDIGTPPVVCTDICYDNACDCKEKYYVDDNTGKCVLPKHCSKRCD